MNRRLGWTLLLFGIGIPYAAAQAEQGLGTDIVEILSSSPDITC